VALLLSFTAWGAVSASAQVTPAAGSTPPDDTPNIRLGLTLWPQYTLQTEPKVTDAAGNQVEKNAFDVGRAYINITGQLSHIVAFRLTPDIVRQSSLVSLSAPNSVANDSLVFRIKYAYGQFNLDDWAGKGTWVRLGIQQTPWVDFDEGIYRYRFQGTTFAERQPLPTVMASSDGGVSFHYQFPANYGEFHIGVYNGENYQKVEVNNQKGIEMRGSLRPFAGAGTPFVLRGLRAHFVYYTDHYVSNAERRRLMGNVTYEHKFINAEFDYLDAKDQQLPTATVVPSHGWTTWATPRLPFDNGSSWEALLRYDHWTPNTTNGAAPPSTSVPGTLLSDQHQNRWIVGGAYWFPHQGNVQPAIMLDYDAQQFDNITTPPVKVFAVHGLITF
jgi:hypothetical protein